MDEDTRDYTQGLPIVSPSNMLPVQVIRREIVAPGAVSLFLALPGTTQAPAPYFPGQFITMALPTPQETLYRSYSLSSDGDPQRPWEITVKRMHMGAVSSYFYTSVEEGALLYASLPRGAFTLPPHVEPTMRFVFVAAGSGITPIIGMIRYLALLPSRQQPMVQLHYASRSMDDMIFGDELTRLDPDETWLRQYHYLSVARERMTPAKILNEAGRIAFRAQWYMCGPESLKRDLSKMLLAQGVAADQLHSELFATQQGPAYQVAANHAAGGDLRVVETGAALDVRPRETLLAALERHGYHPNFSCRVGSCGACKLQVIDGEVAPVGETLTQSEREEGYVLGCIAYPNGEVTIASGGRPPAGVERVTSVGAPILPGRGATAVRLRVATLLALGGVVFGAWNLTNHKPNSWLANAAANTTNSAPAEATPTTDTSLQPTDTAAPGQPTATPRPGQPTATPRPGQPTATPAPPTATPKPGQPTATPAPPTATPKPVPTATSTPSK
jgi:ferredoxin-NADP reductase